VRKWNQKREFASNLGISNHFQISKFSNFQISPRNGYYFIKFAVIRGLQAQK
jgi:hypothetical protein